MCYSEFSKWSVKRSFSTQCHSKMTFKFKKKTTALAFSFLKIPVDIKL